MSFELCCRCTAVPPHPRTRVCSSHQAPGWPCTPPLPRLCAATGWRCCGTWRRCPAASWTLQSSPASERLSTSGLQPPVSRRKPALPHSVCWAAQVPPFIRILPPLGHPCSVPQRTHQDAPLSDQRECEIQAVPSFPLLAGNQRRIPPAAAPACLRPRLRCSTKQRRYLNTVSVGFPGFHLRLLAGSGGALPPAQGRLATCRRVVAPSHSPPARSGGQFTLYDAHSLRAKRQNRGSASR